MSRIGRAALAPRLLVLTTGTVLAYFILGAAGLKLAIPPGYASPVFPAAGLALGVVLRFGPRALPGVFLGSAILNTWNAWHSGMLAPATAALALAIAAGSTAQAWVGTLLVSRFEGAEWRALERARDAVSFLLLGGGVAPFVAASVAVASLRAASVIAPSDILYTWLNWYVGDALGVMVFGPLTLCFVDAPGSLWHERRKRMVPSMLATLALVLVAFLGASRLEERQLDAALAEDGRALANRITDRLIAHREVLSSLRHFAEATPDFTFRQFEVFTRVTLRDNPDVFALSFNDLVPGEARESFERRVSALSPLGEYRITERDDARNLVPAASRPEYVAVRYVVPIAGNRPAVGFDINSEPVRRDAIRRARTTGAMAVTAPILLVQESRRQRVGILEILAVHGPGARPGIGAVAGFAVAIVKVDQMIDIATRGRVPKGLVFRIVDSSAPAEMGLLYRSDASIPGPGAVPTDPAPWTTRLSMGDRTWTLAVHRTSAWDEGKRAWLAWAVGVTGFVFATLLQVLLLGMTGRTAVIARANEALRSSQEQLRLAETSFRNTGEALVVTDAAGSVLSTNPAFTGITLYTEEEARGRNMRLLSSGRHPREFFASMFASLAEGRTWQGEIWNLRKDGSLFLARETISAVRDASGTITHYVGALADETESKRADLERESLLAILEAAAAATDLGPFLARVHEAVGTVLYAGNFFVLVNDPASGLLESLYWIDTHDTPPPRVDLGRGCSAYVFRRGAPQVVTPELFESLAASGEVMRVGTPSASWLGAPLLKGARPIGVMVVQDYDVPGRYSERDRVFFGSVAAQVGLVVERHMADEARRAGQARLEEAQRLALLGSWEVDHRSGSHGWSAGILEILEVPAAAAESGTAAFEALVHPDDREKVAAARAESRSSLRPTELEHRLRMPDGRVKWVRSRWIVEADADGTPVRSAGTLQDVTDHVLAREAERMAEARDAAESANRAKSVFLASMSHEIRTPMNAILGFSQLLLGDPGLPARLRGQVEAIVRSGGHLLALINDVLAMSKIEAGRTSVDVAETDLASVLDDLAATFRVRVVEKGLSFEVERSASLPAYVVTDEKKLRQILMNLVGNAVKFTSRGGVKVRVSAEPAEGDVTTLRVEVEDSGPGIAGEDLPRLFQRFEQTRIGREAGTGTGLGLAISRAFARLMGGDITVRSRVGEGSVFRVSLPVRPLGSPVQAASRERRRVVGLPPGETRRRILVADDVLENREVLRQMLGRVGFDVRTAEDGAEALEVVASWHPDLVLMDLRMPGLDGLETIRRVRAAEAGRGRLPILAVTASAFEEDRKEVEAAGGDGFVSKPFPEDELLRTVARTLGVRYLHEGDGAETAAPGPEAPIEEHLRTALRDAVVAADLDRVLAFADDLAARGHPSARSVRELAERYEYDRLLELLSRECEGSAGEESEELR